MRFPILSCLVDSRFHAVPQNISRNMLQELNALDVGFVSLCEALDLTTPSGRALAGMLAVFAEFDHQVHQRPPPAIQSPDQDAIDLPPSGRLDELLPLRACRGPRPHVLNLDGPNSSSLHPASQRAAGAVSSGRGWRREVEPDPKRFCPLSKNPLGIGGETRCVFRGLGMP